MDTGKRIKQLRKSHGMTQPELAEKVGLGFSVISTIELGKSSPTIETATKMAEIFNVSLDYLLTGKERTSDISEDEQLLLETLREDKSIAQIIMDIAKVKKKAINYLSHYQQQHAHAA